MSPYANKPVSAWPKITEDVLAAHPLKLEVILEVALQTWATLWKTRIGVGKAAIDLHHLDVPATVVGYFFEVLFAKEMATRFPPEQASQTMSNSNDRHSSEALFSLFAVKSQ